MAEAVYWSLAREGKSPFLYVGDDGTNSTLWRIPSDGIEGIANYDIDASFEEYAALAGGRFSGGKIRTREITLKAELNSSTPSVKQMQRSTLAWKLVPNVPLSLKISYGYTSLPTPYEIVGYLTNLKISEGNIYEPLTVTLTLECPYPFFDIGDFTSSIASNAISLSSSQTSLGQLDEIPYALDITPPLTWDAVTISAYEMGTTTPTIIASGSVTASQMTGRNVVFSSIGNKVECVARVGGGLEAKSTDIKIGIRPLGKKAWYIGRGSRFYAIAAFTYQGATVTGSSISLTAKRLFRSI